MQVVGSSRGIEHVRIDEQSRQTAKEASLQYVTNSPVGITRKRRGNKFQYLQRGKLITDEITLLRIKKLAIPPAWSNVWVCQSSTGHIQATGFDIKKRNTGITRNGIPIAIKLNSLNFMNSEKLSLRFENVLSMI